MAPTVSIIIPIYNAEATLARCLESVLTQSLRDIELLCVNDGSTDGSVEVLKRFVAQDARIHVFSFDKNYGLVIAVKQGLRESQGKYTMFVDSDDRLLPGACENLVRLIEQYDVDILQFGIKVKTLLPGADDSGWRKIFASNERTSEGINILYDCFSLHRFPQNIWNKIYRGEVCRAAGAAMPDLQITLPADIFQSFFFLYYAKTFRSVPDGPYYEYSVGDGISTQKPTEKQFTQLCASSAFLPAIEKFLQQENALENNRFLVDAIKIHIKSGLLDTMLSLPEITQDTIDLAVKSWGSEVLYDFIKATGLLDVKCETRYRLVTGLVEEYRKLRNNTTITIP
jgi:glycosyltransferase involved in cell wall biosynthesis